MLNNQKVAAEKQPAETANDKAETKVVAPAPASAAEVADTPKLDPQNVPAGNVEVPAEKKDAEEQKPKTEEGKTEEKKEDEKEEDEESQKQKSKNSSCVENLIKTVGKDRQDALYKRLMEDGKRRNQIKRQLEDFGKKEKSMTGSAEKRMTKGDFAQIYGKIRQQLLTREVGIQQQRAVNEMMEESKDRKAMRKGFAYNKSIGLRPILT